MNSRVAKLYVVTAVMKAADLLGRRLIFGCSVSLVFRPVKEDFPLRRGTSQFEMIRFRGELDRANSGFQRDKFVNIFLDTIAKSL